MEAFAGAKGRNANYERVARQASQGAVRNFMAKATAYGPEPLDDGSANSGMLRLANSKTFKELKVK
jgi:hypothetical protein